MYKDIYNIKLILLLLDTSCDGAGARHLIKGSLKTWYIYIDVASPLL